MQLSMRTSSSSANGFSTSRLGHSKSRSRISSHSTMRGGSSASHQKIPVVHDTAITLKRKSGAELGAGVSQLADDASFIKLVEWIRTERLASLPHKGSRWDTVLIRALFFAERLHGFETMLRRYGADSDVASQLVYGHIQLLLELGHENSAALDKAFGFFYRCSLSVASLLARADVLTFQTGTQEQLCFMYTDLLTLVVEVAIRFYKTVHGKLSHSASLDMYETFGDIINVFHSRRESIIESIWKDQISSEGFGLGADFKTLTKWLAPQDRVLATLGPDHTVFADEMAEFTCVWFHDDLTRFIKSENTVLLINGGAGAGKTTLSASIVERLQRAVARKSHSTLYCSVGAAPTQATSLHVVTTLLNQLLEIRVGNMSLYRAVSEAYAQCRFTADAKEYEKILWDALHDALKHPLAGGKEIIMVIDGVDELVDGPSHGQALLDRLTHLTKHGKGVKLVALSQGLNPSAHSKTTKYTISVDDDIRPDIHAVVIRALAHNHQFMHKPGNEQETIVERVIENSNGSFLSAVLVSELLKLEKSPEGFTKASTDLPKPQTTIEELVNRLVTALKPSEEAKLVLSWLVHSARPLTVDEIEHLFSIDTTSGTRSEKRVHVHHIIQSVAPLLSIRENIVRPRHNLVQTSIKNLINSNRITVSVKDRPLDLLYRILTYAKVSLTEKGDPTLDNSDQSLVDKTFRRFHFLEYVIRYWTWHLRQTSIVPKTGEPKVPAELSKVFPDSVLMPILEWICWDDQFPGAQEVELHELAASVRSKVFGEDHATVLQSYINTAFYYETMENITQASKYFYFATTIGRSVLGVSHPVVVECATRFLRLSETTVTTTRTEVMTHREQIFLLLIESYERQYGVTAEIVVETRRILAELYMSIHEEHKAAEVLGITEKETTETTHDHDSVEGREMSRYLRIKLNKSRDGQALETYDHGIFDGEDDQVDTISTLELSQVEVIIKRAQQYIAQKEFLRAEEVYVELWQRLSEICRTTMASEWHAKKIDCAQYYAEFLRTQKREMETASILTCLWQEYEHHELSFSETIISRLTKAAKTLKTIGYFTAALAIFQRASSYYKNVRKESSSEFTQISEEIVETSSQALTRSLETSETSESSSETTQKSIFQSLISDYSKKVDSTTISLSKKLTARYIEERQYSEAITIIESTLKRTWSSFFAASLLEVSMTETFTQESIELVEQLAESYQYQRQFERVEDIYTRLFRAALTNTKNTALLERSRTLLIAFYTQRGLPSKTISVYQELLAVYRRTLGPSHETTIKTLYELAALCRAHARSHPYWVEYYQQIVTALNKDSTTCHAGAIDAAIIVAESYWEERRYTDAVGLYSVLWSTFVSNHKLYKSFSQETFVQNLYERYYQCLEETKADYESLHKVTTQYRASTHSVFGANSTIALESTVALARVSAMSESHYEESIRMYEEASKSTATSSSRSISKSELSSTLTRMWKRQITRTSTSTSSSEEISRGVSIYESQYAETRSKFGYASESSLSSLRELVQLYAKQSKTDVAVKELTTAVTEVISKETSSHAMYEAATSIAQSFHAINQVQRCRSLVSELHRQLIAKEVSKSSEFSFNLTKCSSASLFFLATLEYQIRTDMSITLSQILSEITATYVYFTEFKRVTTSKSALDKILIAGAPLYELLRRTHRQELVQAVENEIVQIFVQRDTANLQLLSKDSPRIFIVSILEYLGKRRATDFVRAVILASNTTLSKLIAQNKFREAYDVAHIAFIYAKYRKGYHGPHAISRGFELASYLDGRGENRCTDEELRQKLLKLSNNIIKEILNICREQKINFAQVQLLELNQLIALLGEQRDYTTLEGLLNDLWNTRDGQRSWGPAVLLNMGRRLVCARFEAGNRVKAIRLCEDIAYNLRRVNGTRHKATLETYTLLAQLYTTAGQKYLEQAGTDKAAAGLATDSFKKAVLVHEDVLRWLAHDKNGPVDEDDDEDEEDTAAAILAEHGISVNGGSATEETATTDEVQNKGAWVKTHLHLLKLAYQRLGSWPKPYSVYERLNAELFRRFADSLKGAEGTEKWTIKGFGAGKAESNEGQFSGVSDWEILSTQQRTQLEKSRAR